MTASSPPSTPSPSPPDLTGRVALVTGATRGIGRAIALTLAAHGADVAACGRSAGPRSATATGGGTGTPGSIEPMSADVQSATEIESVVRRTVDRFGGLDILVNNAGVGVFRPLVELTVDDWRTVLDTNLSGVFFACRAAIPMLRLRGGGWIINVGSLAGSHPFAGGTAYCASKAGLDALTDALMQELRHDDIRVSSVVPGSVDTSFGADGGNAQWKLDSSDVARVVIDLLGHDPRSLPSRVEIRPSRPRR